MVTATLHLALAEAHRAEDGGEEGRTLTGSAVTEITEYYQGDHAPPTKEIAKVRLDLTHFEATLDSFNRLEGELSYKVRRRGMNSGEWGVETSFRVRLRNVVPAK